MFCDRCGTAVPASAAQCPRCAAQLKAIALVPAANPRGVTEWITAGWNAVTANFWLFMGLTVIYLAAGSTVPVLLQAPVGVGLQWAALKQVYGRPAELNDIGYGFTVFPVAVLICLTSAVIIGFATILLLIPGLIAVLLLQFPYLLAIDRKLDFWSAIKESASVSQRHIGKLFGFLCLQIALVIGGLLLCGVGVIVVIPVIYAATAAAYIDLFGLQENTRAAMTNGGHP